MADAPSKPERALFHASRLSYNLCKTGQYHAAAVVMRETAEAYAEVPDGDE